MVYSEVENFISPKLVFREPISYTFLGQWEILRQFENLNRLEENLVQSYFVANLDGQFWNGRR